MKMNKLESKIRSTLRTLGVPQNVLGYYYITTAVELCLEDKTYIRDITKGLYPSVAERHNTTPSRTERAIRHAIELSFANMPLDLMEDIFGNTWSATKGRPANSHYIAALVEYLQDEGRI